jgi:Holliday junction resolvasome RuvABC endonuclease subunit
MPSKRHPTRTMRRRLRRGRAKKTVAKKTSESGLSRRLDELTERIDIVLPEMTARVAALEHLLLELNLCTRNDLRRAREFVREQEA